MSRTGKKLQKQRRLQVSNPTEHNELLGVEISGAWDPPKSSGIEEGNFFENAQLCVPV